MISMVIDLEKERDKWRSKAKHLEKCLRDKEV